MKRCGKRFIGVLPVPKIVWKSIDLRRWYYVWIGGELMRWWAAEYELDELRERYKDIKFKKIPLWKTIIR